MARIIFISYRRGTLSTGITGRIYDRLCAHFGGDFVFWDLATMPTGVNFVDYVRAAIAECPIFLPVIGPGFFNKQLAPSEDYVRIEVATALAMGKKILPILLESEAMPHEGHVPEEMAPLVRINARRIRSEDFHDRCSDLIEWIVGAQGGAARSGPVGGKSFHARGATPSSTSTLDLIAREWFDRGLSVEDPREKVRCFSEAIDLNARFADAFHGRANARAALGDTNDAFADYAQAIKLNPRLMAAFYNRAGLWKRLGDWEQAVADYQCYIAMGGGVRDGRRAKAEGFVRDLQRQIDARISAQRAKDAFVRGMTATTPIEKIRCFDEVIACAPDDAVAHYHRGRARKDAGDLPGALLDYGRAISLNSTMGEAHHHRGVARQASGAFDGAMEDYDRAVDLNPSYPSTYFNRASLRRRKRDHYGAIADYRRYLELGGGDRDGDRAEVERMIQGLHATLAKEEAERTARLWFDKGAAQTESAEKLRCFDEAIRRRPSFPEAYNQRGLAREAAGDLRAALADYDEAVRLAPGLAGAYYNRADVREQLDDLRGAIADYRKYLELGAGTRFGDHAEVNALIASLDATLARRQQESTEAFAKGFSATDVKEKLRHYAEVIRLTPDNMAAHYNLGLARSDARNFEGAIRAFDRAIGLDPTFVKAFLARAAAESARQRFDAAAEDYDRAIRIDPRQVEAWYRRGLLRIEQKAWKLASADFDRVVSLEAAHRSAYFWRAMARQELDDEVGAHADYKKHLEVADADDPDRAWVTSTIDELARSIAEKRNARATALLQQAAKATGAEERARLLGEAVRVLPESAFVHRQWAKALMDMGDDEAALAAYDETLALGPDDAEAHFDRALLREGKDDHAGALADYDDALRLSPNFANGHYNRAVLKTALEDYSAAIADFQAYLRIVGPDCDDAEEVKDRIRELKRDVLDERARRAKDWIKKVFKAG